MHLQLNDPICHKLEFYLHVYFAIFPMHTLNPHAGDLNKLKFELNEFKQYLDSEKSKFAQIPELLPFYALLFVPAPHNHPSFKHLFSKQWAIELRNKLHAFLAHFLPPMGPPLLYEIYRLHRETQKNAGGSLPQITELRRESSDAQNWVQEVEELKKREEYTRKTLIESQTKWTGFSKGILAVCKTLMEACTNKKPADPAKQKSIAAAADKIMKYEKVLETNEKDLNDIEQEYQKALAIDAQRVQSSFLNLSQQQQRDDSESASPIAIRDRSIEYSLPELNYSRVREALKELKDPLKICAILQALRWRITRTSHGPPRKGILQAFVENDLLGCEQAAGNSIVAGLVTSTNKKYF